MTDDVVIKDDVVEQPKLNPEEQRARSFGWVPKEDWVAAGNDPEDWKSAKHFNKDSELYGKINKQSQDNTALKNKLSEVEKALNKLSEHHVKVAQMEREKVLRELKKQKVEALREDDLEAVADIDDKIADIKLEEKQEVQQPQPTVNPVIEQWVMNPDNSWYHEDFDLRDEADRYFDFVMKTKKASSLEGALKMTEDRIKSKHPERFGGTSQVQPEAAKRVNKVIEQDDSASPRKSSTPKKYTLRNLSESDRMIVRNSAKAAGVSEQDYVDILASQGYFD